MSPGQPRPQCQCQPFRAMLALSIVTDLILLYSTRQDRGVRSAAAEDFSRALVGSRICSSACVFPLQLSL